MDGAVTDGVREGGTGAPPQAESGWSAALAAFWSLPRSTRRPHPTAQRCYAWEVDGQVTTVLHTGRVDSPVAAVRASILADGEKI